MSDSTPASEKPETKTVVNVNDDAILRPWRYLVPDPTMDKKQEQLQSRKWVEQAMDVATKSINRYITEHWNEFADITDYEECFIVFDGPVLIRISDTLREAHMGILQDVRIITGPEVDDFCMVADVFCIMEQIRKVRKASSQENLLDEQLKSALSRSSSIEKLKPEIQSSSTCVTAPVDSKTVVPVKTNNNSTSINNVNVLQLLGTIMIILVVSNASLGFTIIVFFLVLIGFNYWNTKKDPLLVVPCVILLPIILLVLISSVTYYNQAIAKNFALPCQSSHINQSHTDITWMVHENYQLKFLHYFSLYKISEVSTYGVYGQLINEQGRVNQFLTRLEVVEFPPLVHLLPHKMSYTYHNKNKTTLVYVAVHLCRENGENCVLEKKNLLDDHSLYCQIPN